MLLKNICQSCGGHLEFEAADAGATIDCPHCGNPTVLRSPFIPQERTKTGRPFSWKSLGIVLFTVALIAAVALILPHYFDTVANVAGFSVGVIGLVLVVGLGLLSLVLIIFWVIFPWMVYQLLKSIDASLKSIDAKK